MFNNGERSVALPSLIDAGRIFLECSVTSVLFPLMYLLDDGKLSHLLVRFNSRCGEWNSRNSGKQGSIRSKLKKCQEPNRSHPHWLPLYFFFPSIEVNMG